MKNSFPCNKNHGQKTFRVKSSRRHSTGKNETQEEGTYRCRKRLKELDKREREGKGDTSLGNFHLRAKKKRKGVNSTAPMNIYVICILSRNEAKVESFG